MDARKREFRGENIEQERSIGVLGPGVGGDTYWKGEFSLLNFHFLWDEEVKRRGVKSPRLIWRFPSLVAAQPDRLKGIQELTALAKDSVVVATGDLFHYGVAYGMKREAVLDSANEVKPLAMKKIKEGLSILRSGDFHQYLHFCKAHLSDAIDTGTVLRYLLGPLSEQVLDLEIVDVSNLFEDTPKPSWVAAFLVAMEKN